MNSRMVRDCLGARTAMLVDLDALDLDVEVDVDGVGHRAASFVGRHVVLVVVIVDDGLAEVDACRPSRRYSLLWKR